MAVGVRRRLPIADEYGLFASRPGIMRHPTIATAYRPVRQPEGTIVHGQRVGGGRPGADDFSLCGEFLRLRNSIAAITLPGAALTCQKCIASAHRWGLEEVL